MQQAASDRTRTSPVVAGKSGPHTEFAAAAACPFAGRTAAETAVDSQLARANGDASGVIRARTRAKEWKCSEV